MIASNSLIVTAYRIMSSDDSAASLFKAFNEAQQSRPAIYQEMQEYAKACGGTFCCTISLTASDLTC